MKKLLASLLALLLILSLCACTKNEDNQSEDTSASTSETTETSATADTTSKTEQQKPVIPAEYQLYDNGAISFYYPSAWNVTDGSITILSDLTTGNNITVVFEAKNDYYATMNTESFNTEMKPMLESMGMSISEASVKQTQNETGLSMTVIAYTSIYLGAEMTQTQYIVNVDDLTYSVTVTEMVPDAVLVETVFNTLNIAS